MVAAKKKPFAYQLWLLVISGIICSLCEGFDGIVAFLALFFSTPGAFVCLIGLVFAVISSVIFYHTDLHDVAQTLGLNLSAMSAPLDKAIASLNDIHSECDKIEKGIFRTTLRIDLQAYFIQTEALLKRHNDLDDVRDMYRKALEDRSLYWMKRTMAMMVGIMFFGNGFFAAQAIVLFFTPLSLMTWPALFFCCSVGFSSWWVHWELNGSEIENIVNCWFGLDQNKLDLLLDEAYEKATQKRINGLMTHVVHQQNICEENERLSTQVRQLRRELRGLRFFEVPAIAQRRSADAQNEAYLAIQLQG